MNILTIENLTHSYSERKLFDDTSFSLEEGKKLVCVTVSDNGVGMDKETAQNFLTVQSKGYGARNVNDRIRLYYGESYHLEVQSIPDEGTTITIKFPAKPYNTKN